MRGPGACGDDDGAGRQGGCGGPARGDPPILRTEGAYGETKRWLSTTEIPGAEAAAARAA